MGSERRAWARAGTSALRLGALSHPFAPLPTPTSSVLHHDAHPTSATPRVGATPRPASTGAPRAVTPLVLGALSRPCPCASPGPSVWGGHCRPL